MKKRGRPSIFSQADDAEILRCYQTEGVALAKRLGVEVRQLTSRAAYLGAQVDEKLSRRHKRIRVQVPHRIAVRVSSVFELGEALA